jgi:O-antigen biosynthesis protein
VPVLVHAGCAVTRYHAQQSSGGLIFSTYGEFASSVDLCLAETAFARRLGANGMAYVLHNYSWPAVLSRFAAALEYWQSLPPPTGAAPLGQS